MSPFAHFLHTVRTRHGIRQTELAEMMGYEQTYISALEVGKKGPPTEAFINRLITVLQFNPEECRELLEAAEASQRKLVIGIDENQDVYWMIKDLRDRLPELTSAQIQLIRQILVLKESWVQPPINRAYLPKRHRNQEAKM